MQGCQGLPISLRRAHRGDSTRLLCINPSTSPCRSYTTKCSQKEVSQCICFKPLPVAGYCVHPIPSQSLPVSINWNGAGIYSSSPQWIAGWTTAPFQFLVLVKPLSRDSLSSSSSLPPKSNVNVSAVCLPGEMPSHGTNLPNVDKAPAVAISCFIKVIIQHYPADIIAFRICNLPSSLFQSRIACTHYNLFPFKNLQSRSLSSIAPRVSFPLCQHSVESQTVLHTHR